MERTSPRRANSGDLIGAEGICFARARQAQDGIKDTPDRITDLLAAIRALSHSPLMGRKTSGGKRELVIGADGHGYVALYRDVPDVDTVFILAIRSQRESGYKRDR